jgi:MFS family permease
MTDTATDAPSSTATRKGNRLAIVFMLGAVLMFLALDTLLKLMAENYPIPQVVFLRALFGASTVLLICAVTGMLAHVTPNRPVLLFRADPRPHGRVNPL